MWYLVTIAVSALAGAVIRSWFIRPTEHAATPAHYERPATINPHTHYHTYTTSDPHTCRRTVYRCALNDLRDTNPDKLSDVELGRLAFVRWGMHNGLYSED